MISLVDFLEDALVATPMMDTPIPNAATPLNTTGMGGCKGFETDPVKTDTKKLRKQNKRRLKKKS